MRGGKRRGGADRDFYGADYPDVRFLAAAGAAKEMAGIVAPTIAKAESSMVNLRREWELWLIVSFLWW
jgi:hypothetical protein